MIDYFLLLATTEPAASIETIAARAMEQHGGGAAKDGTLTATVRTEFHPISQEVFSEILGVTATARVYLGVNNKVDDQDLYEVAQQRVGVVAAAVAAELDAEACLVFELEIIVFRRRKGELVLYDWFSRWRQPELQAMLSDSFRMTSEKEYF